MHGRSNFVRPVLFLSDEISCAKNMRESGRSSPWSVHRSVTAALLTGGIREVRRCRTAVTLHLRSPFCRSYSRRQVTFCPFLFCEIYTILRNEAWPRYRDGDDDRLYVVGFHLNTLAWNLNAVELLFHLLPYYEMWFLLSARRHLSPCKLGKQNLLSLYATRVYRLYLNCRLYYRALKDHKTDVNYEHNIGLD